MESVNTRRRYDSSGRQEQARRSREAVLDAAQRLFLDQGYAATTIAEIARTAGVSVETIYKGFGSKKGLLREAMGVAVVGDSEPIPYAERAEFKALGEGSLDERIARGCELVTTIHERSAGVWQAIVEAAGADPEIAAWRLEMEQARRLDTHRSVALILGSDPEDELITMLWVLYSPETYLKLINDAGFTRAEYAELIVDATRRLAGVGAARSGRTRRRLA